MNKCIKLNKSCIGPDCEGCSDYFADLGDSRQLALHEGQPEYIICAAVYFDDGFKYPHQPINIETGIVICGRRHHNCFTLMSILSPNFKESIIKKNKQGFLTSADRFVDRKEALIIARKNHQILNDKSSRCILISEDLY